MPKTSEPYDTVTDMNGNEMEMPEAIPKRLRPEDEETENSAKKLGENLTKPQNEKKVSQEHGNSQKIWKQ